MSQKTMKVAIQEVISEMMDRIMNRVLYDAPFVREKHHAKRPLYAALVPDEIFKGSHFERRFVTPFGSVWEKLAVVAATEGLGYGVQGHTINGLVKEDRLRRVTEVLNRLEHKGRDRKTRVRPDWNNELGSGAEVVVRIR
ncbi:TdeIII family type II restriction endonuclease [Anaerolineales bacterium HSG25]|nr:TdeIII family type II restriction endonuclease [Anaerolineales bacterium HSG25]